MCGQICLHYGLGSKKIEFGLLHTLKRRWEGVRYGYAWLPNCEYAQDSKQHQCELRSRLSDAKAACPEAAIGSLNTVKKGSART